MAKACIYEVLKRGSRGECVKLAQKVLQRLGFYLGDIDGIYGPMTEEAVRLFQDNHSQYGVKVDGIVGPQTWGVLMWYMTDAEKCQLAPWVCGEEAEPPPEPVISIPERPSPPVGNTTIEPISSVEIPYDEFAFISALATRYSDFYELYGILNQIEQEGEIKDTGSSYIFTARKDIIDKLWNLVQKAINIARNNTFYLRKDVLAYAQQHYPDLVSSYDPWVIAIGETPDYLIIGSTPEIIEEIRRWQDVILNEMSSGGTQVSPQPIPTPTPAPTPTPTPAPAPMPAPAPNIPQPIPSPPVAPPAASPISRINTTTLLLAGGLALAGILLMSQEEEERKPNVILLMAEKAREQKKEKKQQVKRGEK